MVRDLDVLTMVWLSVHQVSLRSLTKMAFFDDEELDTKTKNEIIMSSDMYKNWAKKNPKIHAENVRRTKYSGSEYM